MLFLDSLFKLGSPRQFESNTLKDAQLKITDCITSYKKLFPTEYRTFVTGMKDTIHKQNKHGLLKDTRGTGEWRRLTEIPVTLDNIIKSQATADEWQYYNSETGKLWLAKAHPEFMAREVL